MADAAGMLYLVARGHFLNETDENWQCGLRYVFENSLTTPSNVDVIGATDIGFETVSRTETDWEITSNWKATDGIDTFNPDDFLNDQVAPAWADLLNASTCSHVQLDSLILYPIGSDGKVVEDWKCVLSWTSSFPTGGTSSDLLPTMVSPVLSMGTDRVGRRGRGRMYLPPPGVSAVDADGRMTSTYQTDLLAAAQTFLQAANLTGSPGGPHWWALPAVIGAPWTHYAVITSVNVNNVFGDQRRRKRQAVASRMTDAVSY